MYLPVELPLRPYAGDSSTAQDKDAVVHRPLGVRGWGRGVDLCPPGEPSGPRIPREAEVQFEWAAVVHAMEGGKEW